MRAQTQVAAAITPGRLLFFGVAAAVFIIDRITKTLVGTQIPYGTEIRILGNLVSITNVRNSGAAFGIAPAGAWLFLIASVLVSIGLVVYVVRNPGTPWNDAVLGLILGGTVGNGFDRVVYGTVTDFVNVHFWPVFNVADSAISIGVVLLLGTYLLQKSPNR